MRCCANGTRRETLRSRRRWSLTAVTRQSGGGVQTGMNGKRWSIQEPAAADAHSVPGRKLKQALTIWRRKIQSWRSSRIMQRTFLYCRQMLRPEAIDWSGGNVKKDIAGEPLSAHACLATDARYALGGSFLQEKTIWQPGSRNWHRNGIGRKTATTSSIQPIMIK